MLSIKIEKLTHIYNPGSPFERKALDNVNLEIEEGRFIGLIGHTGSGKSTLIQHLNGLLKPSEGKIIVDGVDITDSKVKLKEIRKKVGLVFQYPEHQLFEETVYKDVAFGPKNMELSEEEIDKRVKEAIELVGLDYETVKERSPFELSGGQRRRVAIAGVLAMKPKVLILDEPTAGLDPKGRDEILSQVKTLHQKQGITIILVSHSMEDVAMLADRLIVMHKGKIAMSGEPKEVFKNDVELENIGLGVPQITYFMRKLKEKIKDINDDVLTVDEAKEEIIKYLRSKEDA
ncbi:energy-coupling factor transporter ATPase [Clostridiaceae bacterium M8S5]|nr:energy-coupling factor transporter ATPase [Clostridiaceae bacterium M8S5]